MEKSERKRCQQIQELGPSGPDFPDSWPAITTHDDTRVSGIRSDFRHVPAFCPPMGGLSAGGPVGCRPRTRPERAPPAGLGRYRFPEKGAGAMKFGPMIHVNPVPGGTRKA